MITPYIDNINIGDFLVFKKNPTPGYLYGIKYIDITSNEYTWRIVDKSSSLLNNFAICVYATVLIRRIIL